MAQFMNTLSITSQIESNRHKTWIIMGFFTLFLTMVAYFFGKAMGSANSYAIVGLLIAGFMSIASYYFGDRLVLSLSGAKIADSQKDSQLYDVVSHLVAVAEIPIPKLYISDDPSPNAFATGRDYEHASICVNRGLLQKLSRNELEGVLAHELSHIKNYDMRLMAIVSILVGSVAILSDMFLRHLWWGGSKDRDQRDGSTTIFMVLGIFFAIIGPLVATLIQLAVSRKREFLADASGALITRNPHALAEALEKISRDKAVPTYATAATAHMYIIHPFKGNNFGGWLTGLLNTHPPVGERIKILRGM